jgi:collagen type VII alpha
MSYPNIVLNTDPNLAFRQHDFIQIVHDENNYIDARIINYNVNTGELIAIPLEYHGSGSFDTWTISLSGEPGTDGGSGTSGISGTSGTSGAAFEIRNKGVNRILRMMDDAERVDAAGNLTFDGLTLTIAPGAYTAPGGNTYRIVYHNDGTAGTAGVIVKGPEFGHQYDGIIEQAIPRNYQHRFVVGQQYVAHIDSEGIHSQSGLRVDGTEIYFPGIPENNDAQTDQARYLTFDPDDDGNGAGRIQWVTGIPTGTSGTSGAQGAQGASGRTFTFLGGWSQTAGLSDVPYGLNDIVVWPTSGPGMIVYIHTAEYTTPIGSVPPNLDPNWKVMVVGGNDGTSGTSGENGTSGTSGNPGTSGSSGESADYRGTSYDTINLATLPVDLPINITTSEGLSYTVAQHLIVANSNNDHLHGDVISYNPVNGQLSLMVTSKNGNGTWNQWTTNLDGAAGGNGTSGTSGSSGSGFNWQGTWNPSGSYISDTDVVFYEGSSYIKIAGNGNSGSAPADDLVRWDLFVEGGTSGTAGPAGAQGAAGFSGMPGSSGSSGTSGTGSPGTSGTSGASTPGPQNYVQVLGSQVNSVSTLGITIVSGSITTTGNPVKIQVTGDANPQSAAGWVRLQIHRNGTAVGNIIQAETAGNNVNVPYCVDFIDTPAAGTYTYSMRTVSGISGTFQFGEASGPTLSIVELSGAIGSSGTSGVSGTSGLSGSHGTSGASAAASYMRGSRSTTQTSNLTANSLVAFTQSDNSASSDISLNTGTGQITLAAGKTYRLMAQVPTYSTSSNTVRPSFCWYNETTSAWIGSQSSSYSGADTASFGAIGGLSDAVITVSSTTVVSFRILGTQAGLTGLGGNIDFDTRGSYPWFDIEVISGYSPVANGTSGTSGAGTSGSSGSAGSAGTSGTSSLGVLSLASGIVNAGTFVTLDNIKATITTGGQRGLSLATVSGTFACNIGGNFAGTGVGSGGTSGTATITTSTSTSIFGWGFTNQGDIATYIITDTTNSRAYRITIQIGNSFNNNFVSIERLY